MAGWEVSLSVGDEDYARWDAGNIRGLGKRRRFVRVEKDADGNEVNVYELADDDEWNIISHTEHCLEMQRRGYGCVCGGISHG